MFGIKSINQDLKIKKNQKDQRKKKQIQKIFFFFLKKTNIEQLKKKFLRR